MKKRVMIVVLIVITGFFGVNLLAQNKYYYKRDNIQTQHYIDASRAEVKNNNLSLACTYARKAIQANSWSKKAWANYDDIVKRLINKGKVKNFQTSSSPKTTVTVTPKPQKVVTPAAPSPSDSGSLFEGC